MSKRFPLSILLLIVATAAPAFAADVPDADAALAARIADIGTAMVRQKTITPADVDACSAMLKAAAKLDPSEARYPRLLVENSLAQRDADAAIAALKMYRVLQPDDLGAQIKLSQLNLGKMETVDNELAYVNRILGADSVQPDVKSALAVTSANLLAERGQQADAEKMIDNAIRLNSLNIEALRLRYQNGLAGMSDFQKTEALMTMIKANPLQPPVVAELAERLADFGLVKQSLDWYFIAVKLYQKTGRSVPLDLAIDYAAEQFLAERYDGADGLAIRLLQAEPNFVDALYLRLLCAKTTPVQNDDVRMHNYARKALLARLKAANDTANGIAATQPVVQPDEPQGPTFDSATGLPVTRPTEPDVDLSLAALPDLSSGIAKFDKDKDSLVKNELIEAISDLAWYSIYFDPQPEVTQAMLDALAKLVSADNVTLVRLQGWSLLKQNKPDEASVKLSAIADRDAMAQLGLITLKPDTDADANAAGRKLISENPSHMLGVFVKESLRSRGLKVMGNPKAQAIAQQMQDFPVNWMDIVDKPSDFYLIRGEPTEGQFDYGEPMLVKVTIQNLSQFDITIGPDGVIRNDLWMDAEIPVPNQKFPGTAYDRITQQIVLRARQTMSQVVRIDQGALAKVLSDNPTAPQQIWVTVLTNPVRTNDGGVGAGPGGYRVQLSKLLARAGFGIGSDKVVDAMLNDLVSGTIGKISKMDLMAEYMRQAAANPADAQLAQVTPKFKEKLTAVRVDPSASVRGYAQYISAKFADPVGKPQQIVEMSRSDDWTTRLLAAVLAADSTGDTHTNVLTELSNDKEPSIKQFATAVLARSAPTTQPTTAPATQP